MAITHKDYTLTLTTRKDSRCVNGELLGRGVRAYNVPSPLNKGKGAWLCLDDAAKRYTAEWANAQKFAPENISSDGLEYAVVAKCSQNDILSVLPKLLYTHNGRMAKWYPTANGFASPTYGNMRFHDKLTTLAEVCCHAEVSVTISKDGVVLDVASATWQARNGKGQFSNVKSAKQGAIDGFTLLDAVDMLAQPHRIDTRKRIRKCAADVK